VDNSLEVIKGFPCRLIRLDRHAGAAKARNTGAQRASGDILFFTDADWQMLSAKSDEALNKGEDGQEYSWSNPDSGSSGSFVAGPAADRGGQSCRLMTIVTQAGTASNTSQFTFCRQENGEWRIVR